VTGTVHQKNELDMGHWSTNGGIQAAVVLPALLSCWACLLGPSRGAFAAHGSGTYRGCDAAASQLAGRLT